MFGVIAALIAAAPSVAAVPLGGDYWQGTDVAAGEVWGVADLHAHFFNFLGFGGRVLHGTSFAPAGMPQALASCRRNHGDDGRGHSTAVLPEPSHDTRGYPGFEGWPRYDSLIHQQAYVEWVRRAWQGGVRLVQMDVQNTPVLGKAYRLANALTMRGNLTPVPLDDAQALPMQVGAARLFFEGPAADFAAIARSPAEARQIIASGKMAVVLGIEVEALGNFKSEAALGVDPRRAIGELLDTIWASGVRHVLPIHLTSNAFGQPAVFETVLNAMNFVDTGHFYATGEAFDAGVRFDPRGVPGEPVSTLVGLLGHLTGQSPFPKARAIAASAGLTTSGEMLVDEMLRRGFIVDVEHMSQQGVDTTLTLARAAAVPVISSHTHFRDLSFGTTVSVLVDGGVEAHALGVAFGDDPAAYGVSDARKVRSDRSRTREQLEAIAALGGMVGVQLVSGGVGVSWRDQIPLDCDRSSKGFLQMLAYADEMMPGVPGRIGIASDVGGFATMPAPRFGVDACPGARDDALRRAGGRIRTQALAQRNGVQYHTPLASVGPWRFARRGDGLDAAYTEAEARQWLDRARRAAENPRAEPGPLSGRGDALIDERWGAMTEGPNVALARCVAGTREFDVNVDGMAHYGMLPDFLQDSVNVARAAGRPEALKPLFRSAEVYLEMWEKIEQRAVAMSAQRR